MACASRPVLLTYSSLSQELPDLWWCDRDIDVSYSEMPEGVYYCVDDGGGRSDCSRFSDAFRSERVMWRRGTSHARFPFWRLDSGREQVIHETALQDIAAFVVLNLFVEGGTQSHG